ncbi:MAG: isocitrate lyase/phosphoenolpyruvate mutase family protein [Phycisphaerales bacterium]|nr:isocitrate lyase/phosphoenolpyruvate mutase family protein [Phycisphaerales bacterium]
MTTSLPPSQAAHPGLRLRSLMDSGVVAAPGAFNALVARAVRKSGFQAAYVSGGAISVAAGVPDVGILSLDHFARIVREVAGGSGLPVIADADTGFGEEEMVRRTVLEYNHAGAAGLHLEDQVFPKRCGHLDGKSLISIEQMVSKIQWAAKASQDCSDGAFIICARTDAKGVEGIDAAIERAKAYVDAGATMIFPEGLHSEDEFALFADAMNSMGDHAPYMLANMTEFGKTPMIGLERYGQLGYHLVIFPVSTLRIAMGAITKALAELKATGTLEGQLGAMQSRKDLYELMDYTPGTAWELPTDR